MLPECPDQNHKAHFSAIVRNALPAGKQQMKLLLEMQEELEKRRK